MALLALFKLLAILVEGHDLVEMHLVLEEVIEL